MTDYTFFSALTDCIHQGGAPVLCTIVDSAGSAPRGAGARMGRCCPTGLGLARWEAARWRTWSSSGLPK